MRFLQVALLFTFLMLANGYNDSKFLKNMLKRRLTKRATDYYTYHCIIFVLIRIYVKFAQRIERNKQTKK